MKHILTPLFFLISIPDFLYGQNLIALHHNGQASFFTELEAAYDAAADGDTLYLPGGSFSQLILAKSLHIVGAGYHPDSTMATSATLVSGITLSAASNGSNITGLYITGQLNIEDATLSNVSISRCYINAGVYFASSNPFGFVFCENIIGKNGNYSVTGTHSKHHLFSNNIIAGGILIDIDNSEISNNVFLPNNYFLSNLVGGTACVINNNIFTNNNSHINYGSSIWHNNLNDGVNGVQGSNQGSNNYLDTPPIFVNYSGSGFSFSDDYHLVANYIGADGKPIGIFGGRFPWKEGGIPYNPHIQLKDIAPATDADGKLKVKVKVSAQGN